MGFGALFGGGAAKGQSALTEFSNQMALQGGMAQRDAANSEAEALRKQGDMAYFQSLQAAELKKREVAHVAGEQTYQYGASGVSQNMGTPLMVVNETRKLGQIEVDAILSQGSLMADLFRSKADITERMGLSALLQAQGQGVINSAQTKINQQAAKAKAFGGLLDGALDFGLKFLFRK